VAAYSWEWLACRAEQRVLIDTSAHGEYFVKRYRLPTEPEKNLCPHARDTSG
jgi:hypothetical protein